MGFTLPASVTGAAVRSYRTFSPLPDRNCSQPGGIVFCGTFRKTRFKRIPPAVSRHAALWRPDFPPVRLPFGFRTGDCLPSRPHSIIIRERLVKEAWSRRQPLVMKRFSGLAHLRVVRVCFKSKHHIGFSVALGIERM